MGPLGQFKFSKWYMDCVTPQGGVFIGYSACLEWAFPEVHFAQTLEYSNSGGARAKTVWGRHHSPEMRGDVLAWAPQRLPISGQWQRRRPGIQQMLLANELGTVDWRCCLPHADSRVDLGSTLTLIGLGYAEHLVMTIKPWDLPIDELRWGRYLSDHDSLVWIDWRGPEPHRWVFHNASPVLCRQLTDDVIEAADGDLCLQLSETTVIRDESLLPTLSQIPFARKILPAKIFGAHERKWRSRGALTKNGVPVGTGWVIHEVVTWD